MKKPIALVFSSFLLLTSCEVSQSTLPIESSSSQEETSSSSQATPSSSSSLSPKYKDVTVDVHYLSNIQKSSVNLRFFEKEGNIPYISFMDYYDLLYHETLADGIRADTLVDGDMYHVYSQTGEAIFDVNKNTFYCPDIRSFANDCVVYGEDTPNVPHDGLPFVRPLSVSADRLPNPTYIFFSEYDIRVYGDDHDVYAPLNTLSDMLTAMGGALVAYNFEAIYVTRAGTGEDFSSFNMDLENIWKHRDDKLKAFDYNEQCLNFDYFLGRPNRSVIEYYYDLSNGLDAALTSTSYGRKVKELLLGDTATEYIAGWELMNCLIADGGHAGRNIYLSIGSQLPTWLEPEVIDQVVKIISEVRNTNPLEIAKAEIYTRYKKENQKRRNEILGKGDNTGALHGEETYSSLGDTAMISIDGFTDDYHLAKEWKDYYAGKSDAIPYGPKKGGCVSAIYKGLEKATSDPSIKNIVIEMVTNGGGSSDEMLYLLSMIAGINEYHVVHAKTGQRMTIRYEVDRNLDRKFDEKDLSYDPLKGRHVAFVTSDMSFSCGGIAPVLLHEAGIYSLGDHSGGGSCAVYMNTNAFGLFYRSSCPFQLCDSKFASVDAVRFNSCDTYLPIVTLEDGSKDYSSFYDLSNISELMNARFAA